jgi:hypothetical protein
MVGNQLNGQQVYQQMPASGNQLPLSVPGYNLQGQQGYQQLPWSTPANSLVSSSQSPFLASGYNWQGQQGGYQQQFTGSRLGFSNQMYGLQTTPQRYGQQFYQQFSGSSSQSPWLGSLSGQQFQQISSWRYDLILGHSRIAVVFVIFFF